MRTTNLKTTKVKISRIKTPRMKTTRKQAKSLTQSAQKAMPAVVQIHCRGFTENHWPSLLDPRKATQEEWTGSGFFIQIQGEEGWILTNSHVARGATHLEIRSILTSDEPFDVECFGLVAGLEPDVALLKMKKEDILRYKKIAKIKKIPYLKFSEQSELKRGEPIKAIGYPLGMEEPNISAGEISNFISGTEATVERFVTDAAINLGNSGGPAINQKGEVVGINTAIIFGANNISFITPIKLASNLIPLLAQGIYPKLPSYGAHLQRNSDGNAMLLGMKECKGIIISQVLKGGMAQKAGLKKRDVIVKVNNHEIDRHGNSIEIQHHGSKKNIYDLLHITSPQDSVRIKLWSKGKCIEKRIKTSPISPIIFPQQPLMKKREFMCVEGLIVQDLSEELVDALGQTYAMDPCFLFKEYRDSGSSLLITHICPDSKAEDFFLEVGDFVVRVNEKKVSSLKDFNKILKNEILRKKYNILIETSSGLIANFNFLDNSMKKETSKSIEEVILKVDKMLRIFRPNENI